MNHWTKTAALVGLLAFIAPAGARETRNFDADWRFHMGEIDGAEKPETSDADWRTLDVPHDWMIEQPFDEHSAGGAGSGALDGGVGWYRKTFTLPASAKDQHVFIDFDGVYMNSDVWLNGKHIGKRPYGYSSFEYDLTPSIKFDSPNVLAVRSEVVQPASRFYSGGGIYRHVRLVTTDPVHVAHWGTKVKSSVDGDSATIEIANAIQYGAEPVAVEIENSIFDDTGKSVASIKTQHAATTQPADSNPRITIAHPKLWSTETPTLYRLQTNVIRDGKIVDSVDTSFGIRTIEFTKDNGFLLNGKHVDINGVCDHHDLGCLGAAVNTRALQRQLEILRSFGVNGIRTSHNPPTPELLDLCDRMGFVVMDEAFDEWKHGKRKFGYARFFDEWSDRDLSDLILRDRNHPSVVMWSIGNEIPEQGTKEGAARAKHLTDVCHQLDPSRPVTSAISSPDQAVTAGFAAALDIFGVNYNPKFYDAEPIKGKQPMIGSETSSDVSSRGEYGLSIKEGKIATTQKADFQMSSYDTYAPRWATTAEVDLMAVHAASWVAGEFVWTGFDYLGEPTPFGWPSRSSYFGVVDLAGFPKDRYYLYQSRWTTKPMVHLLPHWNWPGFEGKPIDVWAYTNADTVELFLNGRSLGEQAMDGKKSLHVAWSVPYEMGELKAVAKKGGTVVATDIVHTAGEPAKLELVADRSTIDADGNDLSFITVSVLDSNGVVCPNAKHDVTYSVTGPGAIAGLDDGDATNHQPFKGPDHRVFHGLGLAVIRAARSGGTIHVSAMADGLPAAAIDIIAK